MEELSLKESKWKLWWLACRPKTLGAAVAPVLIATSMAFAHGYFHFFSAMLCITFALFIQVGTNFANDFFDFKNGADTEERLGPKRMTQAGLIKSDDMAKAVIFTFGIAILIASYLIARGGWPFAIVVISSIVAGVLYTGGPKPYGYHGLGDVFVFVFFGLVAVGATYYIQSLSLSLDVILAGTIPGFLSVAILVVNNYRDREGDKAVGKRTLAVILGEKATRLQYVLCLWIPCILTIILGEILKESTYIKWASVLVIFTFPLIRDMYTLQGKALNALLARTSRFLILFSVVLSGLYLWK
jgi:1,4-dihydroxy-2-naphthoate octaprenyltransferase